MTDSSIFDFDSLKNELGSDPFEEKTQSGYARDERFYTLGKDADGNGVAIIRFLPDSERGMIQQMFKINTNVQKNGQKRFVNEFSPQTIGAPCPFQEKWAELWNGGDKEGAKVFARSTRFVTNIKVIKDPQNPENEGKIFLYEMSSAMRDKIRNAIDPSPQDRALGTEPKELFNPLKGYSFKLACKKGANGQITYDPSGVMPQESAIYDTVEEALADIKANTHKLSDLLKPEAFLSYDELVDKFNWVTFANEAKPQVQTLQAEPAVQQPVVTEVQPVQQVQQVQQPVTQEAKVDSLDALLDGLV